MIDYEELKNRVRGTLRGFPEFCGIDLLEVNDEYTKAVMTVNKTHCNAQKIVHGGVIATLLDESAGMATFYHTGGKPIVTRSATVHFLAPSFTGDHLTATAKVIQLGHRTALIDSEIRDDNQKLIATGSFEMIILKP